jgi:hypothetical protein
MVKNVSAEFATMDDDERKKFGGKLADATDVEHERQDKREDEVSELAFPPDDPRDADKMGRHIQPNDPELREQEEAEAAESGAVEEGGQRKRRPE